MLFGPNPDELTRAGNNNNDLGSLWFRDMTETSPSSVASNLSRDDVIRICGDIDDWKVKAIIDTKATLSDLELANAWATGEDETLGEEREPLSGTVAEVYDILLVGEEFEEEE